MHFWVYSKFWQMYIHVATTIVKRWNIAINLESSQVPFSVTHPILLPAPGSHWAVFVCVDWFIFSRVEMELHVYAVFLSVFLNLVF